MRKRGERMNTLTHSLRTNRNQKKTNCAVLLKVKTKKNIIRPSRTKQPDNLKLSAKKCKLYFYFSK